MSLSTSVPPRPATAGLLALAFAAGLAGACRTAAFPAPLGEEAVVPRMPAPAAGRGTVAGGVADSASGTPVWGAVVYFTRDSVIGTGRATPRPDLPSDTTGRDGAFRLPDVPPGRYTLAVHDLDHHPMRTIVIVRQGLVHSVVLRPRRLGAP